MQNDILASLTHLSDASLIARTKSLISRERDVTAEVIAHLAELDTRDAHLREGYPSLFVYCRDALGLSESEAYNRIEVARAVRSFPVILDMLAEGSLNLTAARLLAPHLTASNHLDALQSARGKRKPEVQEIVARLSPRPDVPFSIRRLPAASARGSQPRWDRLLSWIGLFLRRVPLTPPPAGEPSTVRPAPVTPLSPDRYKLQLTIGGDTLERLRLAKDMLGHAMPSADDAAVIDRALTVLLADLAKKKFADTPRPRSARGSKPEPNPLGAVASPLSSVADPPAAEPSPPAAEPNRPAVVKRTRNPSAAVKRAVWLRDLGRCAFVGTGGHRCNERRFVEFHHVDPYALGGAGDRRWHPAAVPAAQ